MSADARSCGPVLIVDDDAAFRTLLIGVLERSGFHVRAAATGEDGLALARRERPSAVVLDVRLPGISGWEVCHELRGHHGDEVPILFVSGERIESLDRVAGLLLGGDDYLVKPFAPDELLARLKRLVRRTAAEPSHTRLTPREREVLGLLADGKRGPDIAAELVISPKTVSTHVDRILAKLGVNSRAQAVALAYRERLLDGESA
jgi:DNA-binding response OmpR family regulator